MRPRRCRASPTSRARPRRPRATGPPRADLRMPLLAVAAWAGAWRAAPLAAGPAVLAVAAGGAGRSWRWSGRAPPAGATAALAAGPGRGRRCSPRPWCAPRRSAQQPGRRPGRGARGGRGRRRAGLRPAAGRRAPTATRWSVRLEVREVAGRGRVHRVVGRRCWCSATRPGSTCRSGRRSAPRGRLAAPDGDQATLAGLLTGASAPRPAGRGPDVWWRGAGAVRASIRDVGRAPAGRPAGAGAGAGRRRRRRARPRPRGRTSGRPG